MQNALLFIVSTLFNLYVLTFAFRLLLQWARVGSRNPLLQFVMRVTDPVVLPLRRLLPAAGRIDTATVVALLGLQLLGTALLVRIGCVGSAEFWQLLSLAVLRMVDLGLTVYTWSIIIYVVLSWVSPGGRHPAMDLVGGLVEPVLGPFRRLIPPIGGFDLSPLFALIVLQALGMLLPTNRVLTSMLCSNMAASML
jgi:YggT family protein